MVTLVKVVWLPDVDKHKCHELKLWQPLSGWTGQGQKVPQVGNLGVDQIPSHLGRASGTLSAAAATSTAIKTKKRKKKWAATTWMIAGMHADEAIKNTRKLHKQGRLNYGQPASAAAIDLFLQFYVHGKIVSPLLLRPALLSHSSPLNLESESSKKYYWAARIIYHR